MLERRQRPGGREHLVDLLLVARDREARAAMVEHIAHLLGHRVLVERYRHRAAGLRRDHRPVEMRPVASDDGDVVARLQPQRGEPGRQSQDLGLGLGPGPAAPDAEVLLAICRKVAELSRVPRQETGKRVETFGASPMAHGPVILPSRDALPSSAHGEG